MLCHGGQWRGPSRRPPQTFVMPEGHGWRSGATPPAHVTEGAGGVGWGGWSGRHAGGAGGWGGLVGIVPTVRQDRTAGWRDFAVRVPWQLDQVITTSSPPDLRASCRTALEWARTMAVQALDLHPDVGEARAADAAAVGRTRLARPIHLALLAVARAGWDRDAAHGQSAHRGREPVPEPPPLLPGPGVAQAISPALRLGRWPHLVRYTPAAPRRIYAHGLGTVHRFVAWCAGRRWWVERGVRLSLARLVATWAKQPGMPPYTDTLGREWWRCQCAFFGWFLPFWDGVGVGALLPRTVAAGPELGWELTGEGLATPEEELAFRRRGRDHPRRGPAILRRNWPVWAPTPCLWRWSGNPC